MLASDAGHGLVTWHLPYLAPRHQLLGHTAAVMQILACGDRLLPFDRTGSLVLWGADSVSSAAGAGSEGTGALLRRVEVAGPPEGLLGADLDLRRVAGGSCRDDRRDPEYKMEVEEVDSSEGKMGLYSTGSINLFLICKCREGRLHQRAFAFYVK